MRDPYDILGVARTADEAAIRSAYRKLAKSHHPDVNPGDAAAEGRFKETSQAYALLSDADKRARFDRGEIDGSGAERQPERRYWRDTEGEPGRAKYRQSGGIDADDLEDLLAQAFGRTSRSGGPARGRDARYTLTVDFLDAANGATRRLTLPDGDVLDVSIPAGLRDGQILKLKGKGGAGRAGAPLGDALIEVTVAPHKLFTRDGDDVVIELPVTLQEVILGAKIEVPTLKGPVTLAIPAGSNNGTRLRLKGRGFAGGHQYVDLKLVLPPEPDEALAAFLRTWQPARPFDPRGGEPS